MKLILIGCEYSGTTTLSTAIREWLIRKTGNGVRIIHDHWKLPHTSGHAPSDAPLMTDDEMDQVMALGPKLREMTQRHSLVYHTPAEHADEHRLIIGYHFDDGIYGSLYFDYGGPDDDHDRSVLGPQLERVMLKHEPGIVLVLVKASSSVIRRRMSENPHHRGVLQDADIELVQERFEDGFKHSLIGKRITLDTSEATVEESVAEFAEKVRPHLTEADRSLMLLNRGTRRGP